MFPGPTGTALFISDNQGQLMNLMTGSISDSFKLHPSSVLRPSPIADYLYYQSILFAIREDGLLFSWCSHSKAYKTMVQTDYRCLPKRIEALNTKNVLYANQGFLMVNCS
jgi:hypothetical protein